MKFKTVARMLYELSKNHSKNHQDTQKMYYEKHLIPEFGGRDLRDINFFDVHKYLTQKSRTRTVAPDIKFFRKAIKTARSMGLKNIQDFTIPNVYDNPVEAGRVVSRGEVASLMWHARRDLRLQIFMAYTMGMRRSEVCHFRYEFLDFKTGMIHLPASFIKTKKRDNRRFLCNRVCFNLIRRLRESSQGVFLFPSQVNLDKPIASNRRQWEACREKAKVSCRFHDLRHSAITNAIAAAVPAAFVSIMYGVSEEVMRRYTHVPEDYQNRAVNLAYKKAA